MEPENVPAHLKALAEFVIRHHSDQLRSITLSPDPKLHYPLYIDFAELLDEDPEIAHLVFSKPADYLRFFEDAAIWAHKIVFDELKSCEKRVEKKFIHVRINVSGSPLECPETFPSIGRVRVKHHGVLLTLKGTVIRSGATKMYEGERTYMCRKCKHMFPVYPELETRNSIVLPSHCPSQRSKPCEGTNFQFVENSIICHDYQEIKIQESTQVLGVGVIPRSILVILKDDLVDIVKAGDDVIVTGILTAKWSPDLKDVRCDLDPVLIANHVRRTNELKSDIDIPDDIIMQFKQFWSEFKDTPLKGRNAILRGICPQVFGLFTVKLAVALTLIGGVQHVDASGTKVRGESHLLLVGDPGTGKSQFLKFAAKLSNRSVITTGLGSTSAGLTVTAVKDGGEWMLEAGALVLADGGLCCIDEFDRFDIVLVLLDTKNPEWDAVVSSHILAEGGLSEEKDTEPLTDIWPLAMLRRYIYFVKGYFKPILTKEAEKVISSYYQLQRRSATQNAARTTVRMLESLIRLAQGMYVYYCLFFQCEFYFISLEIKSIAVAAHARLMFRNEVTQLDAITAILCIESSMTTSAIVDSVGNALHSNFTENPDLENAKQEKLILDKLRSFDEFPDIISTQAL
ncbi:putative DNA helicase MCM9 [Citrus sinensis]|nr:putative DNA helicase MCM9 [Citrus sinensis]